ncbi:MAG: nicotinamide riboside transporter PnuC [Bacteroidota bacterium]
MSQLTFIELAGATMTFLNVIYAIREQWEAWIWAILSACFYGYIYWNSGLVISAEIQVLYFIISIYGLSRWVSKSKTRKPKEQIKSSSMFFNIVVLIIVISLAGILYYINSGLGEAETIAFDAMLVSSAIVAQWLTAKKYIFCWYLWIFVNIGYLPLFIIQELWVSLILYTVLFYFTYKGYKEWHYKLKRNLNAQPL